MNGITSRADPPPYQLRCLHNPTAQGQTTIEIGIESLLAARKEVNSLYKRDPEGVLAIENRAKAFAEAASSYTPSPFELPDIDIDFQDDRRDEALA